MAADTRQYDWRGTRTSWRHWKRRLKKSTGRMRRRQEKVCGEDTPRRQTGGWVR